MFYVKGYECSEGNKVLISAREACGVYRVHIFQMTGQMFGHIYHLIIIIINMQYVLIKKNLYLLALHRFTCSDSAKSKSFKLL